MMSIAAYTVKTRPVGVRQTVAAVILSACDWRTQLFRDESSSGCRAHPELVTYQREKLMRDEQEHY